MSKQAVINVVVLAITIICAIGSMLGHDMSALNPETMGVLAGGLVTVIAPAWLAWKDTPLTGAGKKGHAVTVGLKRGFESLSPEEREALADTYTEIEGYLRRTQHRK
jgi:hypothetical protein